MADGCPSPTCSAEEHWNQLQSSNASSTEGLIGRSYHSSLEWFAVTVDLLIDKKNEALQKWLQRDTRSRKCSFHRSQRAVQNAVNKAKEEKIAKVASEAEAAVKDGRVKWNSIHRLRVYGGCRPVRPTVVFKDGGELKKGPSEILHRCFQHYKKVLNLWSIYDLSVSDALPVSPFLFHLDDPPAMAELKAAMSRLKTRKAGGMSGIFPELVLCISPVLLDRLLMLMQAVWREG